MSVFRDSECARIGLPTKKKRGQRMKAIDKIIGYSAIKGELRQIGDTLKNREAYEKLGASTPKGLLLYGEPGVGKSLMATAVIEESGRQAFTCRKDKPNGDFVKHIKETFDLAAANVPSIIYLDDMDKFSNGDAKHPDAEEYVTVQSCIDEVKDKDVFVLATVNNISNLPKSLRRVGRFDRTIEVDVPRGKDAEKIIEHYLSTKKFVAGVDPKTIARIMDGRSCAELETVINEAGIFASYERAEYITMNHFIEACMRTIFNASGSSDSIDTDDADLYAAPESSDTASQIIWHEAGHTVVSEVLCPDSITLVSSRPCGGRMGGFTAYYNDRSTPPLYWLKSRVVGALGGMAAIEQIFGIFDAGNSSDLDIAFDRTRILVESNCTCGLHLHRNRFEDSERLTSDQEQAVASEVEKFYMKAKEIIALNREFLEKVADALAKKKILVMADIKEIKESCRIVPVSL